MATACKTSSELSDRVTQARKAQREWAATPIRQRLQPVRRFRRLLVEQVDALTQVIAREVGKSTTEALAGEVLGTADACRFLEQQATALLAPRRVSGRSRPIWLMGQSDVVHHRPRGVVGIIGTWNYPLFLNAVQILQALTAGNAVIWKPSEVVPGLAELLKQLLLAAGFPSGCVHCLPAQRELGPLLAEAEIDHVVFTGSARVGKTLAARLGERLISSTLELSGCDAQFVLDDAEVDLAARATWFSLLLNRSQTCLAVRRVLVHRAVYQAYQQHLAALAAQNPSLQLTLASQVTQADRLIEEAVHQGARLLVPRGASQGDTCQPGILVDATPEMALCKEAPFAPIVAIMPFDNIEQALEMNDRCPFALGASIFTKNIPQAQNLAQQLRVGSVAINDVIVPTSHPATPLGGSGESGWGVTQGAEGLLEMTIPQVVSLRSGRFRPHYDMGDPRAMKQQGELLRGILQATHSPLLSQRLAGWWRVVRAVIWGG